MSDQPGSRSSRRVTAVIVGVLVLVIAAVTGVALLTAGGATPAATTTSPVAAPTVSASQPSTVPTVTPTPLNTATPTPSATAAAPQPTRTTTIASTAPITKALTAEVTKLEAVQGKAQGPGEIAGPSVRFTIEITNSTGSAFDLSSTVVNAYYGAQGTPATQLEQPGGKPFPTSVAAGRSVSGVFVFNIPSAERKQVKVTVDTSVDNPVVAFVGSAPR